MPVDEDQILSEMLSQDLEVFSDAAIENLASEYDLDNETVLPHQIKADHYAYRLGELAFFLPEDVLTEIIESVDITFVPLMPKTVLGLCNVRGNLVPVFDLHGFLDMQRTKQDKHLLCIGVGDNMVGVLLDEMPFRVNLSECKALSTVPTLPSVIQSYVSQVYEKDNLLFLDYQHEAFFDSLFV